MFSQSRSLAACKLSRRLRSLLFGKPESSVGARSCVCDMDSVLTDVAGDGWIGGLLRARQGRYGKDWGTGRIRPGLPSSIPLGVIGNDIYTARAFKPALSPPFSPRTYTPHSLPLSPLPPAHPCTSTNIIPHPQPTYPAPWPARTPKTKTSKPRSLRTHQ